MIQTRRFTIQTPTSTPHLVHFRVAGLQVLLELAHGPLGALPIPEAQRHDGPLRVRLGKAVDAVVGEVGEAVEL